jgi:hypothetical protein
MHRRAATNLRHQSPLWAVAAAMAVGGMPNAASDEVAASTPSASVDSTSPRSAPTPSPRAAETGPEERREFRLREGSRLNNVVGRFRSTGDSLTFIDAENREIGGLPNLNLERISRMLQGADEPESITWSVSGTVTEFSGKNYLLISRAVFRAAAPPPIPENIAE